MLDTLRDALAAHYLIIKFFHLLLVMIWAWSTAVAYGWYIRPAFLKWQRQPGNAAYKARRDWVFEQFDRGAVLEHIAFPGVLLTGLLLVWIGPWHLGIGWFVAKLAIIAVVFIPMEVVDYYLSHFGGNKYALRQREDASRYDAMILHHWRFFRITTPLVATLIPTVIYLAVVKPVL